MTIWNNPLTLEQIERRARNTLVEWLGIRIVEIGDDYLRATMPVDHRTHQPLGILHGGASVALAETVGSVAGVMAAPSGCYCVGLDINANHLRRVTQGLVRAVARPIHLGRSTQVWDIRIADESDRPVCISRLTMAVVKDDFAKAPA